MLAELELDALLVESPVDLRYLSGFTGSHGIALMGAAGDAESPLHRFLTDFRYATQSAEQVPDCFEREIVAGELLDALAAPLAAGAGASGSRRRASASRGTGVSASCSGRDGSWCPAPAPSSGCA